MIRARSSSVAGPGEPHRQRAEHPGRRQPRLAGRRGGHRPGVAELRADRGALARARPRRAGRGPARLGPEHDLVRRATALASTPRRYASVVMPTPPRPTARWKSISSSVTPRPLRQALEGRRLDDPVAQRDRPELGGLERVDGAGHPAVSYHPTRYWRVGTRDALPGRANNGGGEGELDERAHRPPGDPHRLGAPGGAAEHEATLDAGDQRDGELRGRGPVDAGRLEPERRPRRPSCRTRRRWRPQAVVGAGHLERDRADRAGVEVAGLLEHGRRPVEEVGHGRGRVGGRVVDHLEELEVGLARGAQHRVAQVLLAAGEEVVERAERRAGRLGHLLDRGAVVPLPAEQLGGGGDDALPGVSHVRQLE